MRDCLLLLSFLSIVSIGCSFTPPDINAGVGGSADGGTPDAFTFADGAVCSSACVSATELRDCGQAGAVVDCALGCVDGVAPKCAALVPSNDVDASLLDDVSGTLFDLAATASWVVDSDTGRIVDGTIEIRAAVEGAVDAGVGFYRLDNGASLFTVTGVLVEAGAEIRFEGSRPVIVASAGEVVVRGLIDVGGGCRDNPADTSCGGPGGGAGSVNDGAAGGCGPGGDGAGAGGPPDEAGGGGGGYGGDGGDGGDGDNGPQGGGGGSASLCTHDGLVPLRGGSGGGEGAVIISDGGIGAGGNGGGGGGGLQITSFAAITLDGAGEIWAGGGGGQGGLSGTNGGGGGGSGGAILLEAPVVSITDGARVTANGGGGGGGSSGGTDGGTGQSGSRDMNQADGGAGQGAGGGGGRGAALAGAAEQGGGPTDGGGGGGGGAGVIHFKVPASNLTSNGSTISPTPGVSPPATE